MKGLFRIVGWLVFAVILCGVFTLLYSTMRGHKTWFFRVNGRVLVDGRVTSGYLHANTERTLLLITRTDGKGPETYLVPLRDNEMVIDCGAWHPIRFLPVPVGGVTPPCSGYDNPTGVIDGPGSSALTTSRTSVEFSTTSGKKITAAW